jgi:hypothetical protein
MLTLVAAGDGVLGIVASLRAADDMLPPGTDLGASGDADDVAVLVLDVAVVKSAHATGFEWTLICTYLLQLIPASLTF